MNRQHVKVTARSLVWGGLASISLLTGCVESVPQEVVDAVESIDRDLMDLRASELSPSDYTRFAHQWMALKSRVQSEEDAIRWPWEPNDLELALRQLQEEGSQTVAKLTEQREGLRHSAEQTLARVEDRFQFLKRKIGDIDGRLVLGQRPVETDLLVKQARTFFQDGQYHRSLEASELATVNLVAQTSLLSRELGRYANPDRISQWRQMAKDTITWSRTHRTSAIVVNKADRTLTLFKNGQQVLSYSVKLGFNGIREKRYQGDGATPEGRYRVMAKRGQGQTQFYRALLLDYPNEEDRRRFQQERKAGQIPVARTIGGQIEIHGIENELMAQTLGCVMLENQQMAQLYNRVEKGTPVTIVGALHERNSIALALTSLGERQDET